MQSIVTSLVIATLGPIAAFAQKPDAAPCGAMSAPKDAAREFLTFNQFDSELRAALTKQDAVALAFLVRFPLRVNATSGTISIDDVAALKTHFNEVFTPAGRKEILESKSSNFICNVEGIGYKDGVIWVGASDRGYTILAVNRDGPYPTDKNERDRVEFLCVRHRRTESL